VQRSRSRIEMSGRASLRASDADREQVAERLQHAATEGRLLPDELDERLGTAFSARTYGELDALVADLPSTSLEHRRVSRQVGSLRPRWAFALAAAVAAIIVAGVAAAFSGHPHGYHHGFGAGSIVWLVWVAIGLRFIVHRRHGAR
jgi:hypothetical protein